MCEDGDYIDLAEVTRKRRAVVNIKDSLGETHFCILTSQEGLSCMELVSCLSDKSRNRILNHLSTSPVNSEGTCLENTAAKKFSKIFSGRQPCQSVKMFRRFRDRL
jgi:hypothetical protein